MALAYTAPTWTDGSGEGISASNLQAISNCIEGLVQGSDKAIHMISMENSTITLTFADGTQETVTATGLKGISSITKTGTAGLVDTYTITYTDGTTSTFNITNGAQGAQGPEGPEGPEGPQGPDGADGVSPEVTIASITGGHSVTITDADHPSGQTFNVMDGEDGVGIPSGGTTGQVLKKASNTDYDVEWGTGGGGSTYTAGDGIDITSDVISVDEMPSADMSDVVYPLPTALQPITNPVGCIITMMGVDAPSGYLKCDGTVYNIADYQNLADYFEDQLGSANFFGGDGTTTFKVPDLRGEFLRMTGTNSHSNQGSGANVGVHQDATDNPTGANIHLESGTRYLSGQTYPSFDAINSIVAADKITPGTSNTWVENSTISFGSNSSSGAVSYRARPTNTSVLYCIKF